MIKLIFGDPESITEVRKGLVCKNCKHPEGYHAGYCEAPDCDCADFIELGALEMA